MRPHRSGCTPHTPRGGGRLPGGRQWRRRRFLTPSGPRPQRTPAEARFPLGGRSSTGVTARHPGGGRGVVAASWDPALPTTGVGTALCMGDEAALHPLEVGAHIGHAQTMIAK